MSELSALDASRPEIVRIEPSKGWLPLDLGELWSYRELLYFLVWRDVKVRYKQTLLGVAWAVLQPLFTMVVFSLFFGRLAKVPSDGVPYPIFSFAALVPWTFFANALNLAAGSLVGSAHLITKVYFPRLLVPLAAVLGGVIDFLLAFALLLAMMLAQGMVPGVNALCTPLFALVAMATAAGVGLLLAALNVKYRDVRYVMQFLTQIWLFATPIAYPSSLVPETWRALYAINPMVGVVEGFRWALLGTSSLDLRMALVSVAVALIALVGGLFYFRRVERVFADMV